MQQKGINSFIIKIALKEINEEKYLETLQKLAQTKWNALNIENKLIASI
ncbi:MAG: hypothetical protein WKG06_45420 [Segetibacter sp.]